mgnify:CR=1 FL=1|tara:strand:+ start:164 stop:619 length:456 start_codon:yes stop_codon:yes gene_type:complete
MNNIFDNITVRLPELHYFQQLLRKEKIYYFLELYETSTNSQELQTSGLKEGLQQFFDDLEFESTNELPYYESYDIGSDDHYNRVDILVDNENLVIESNSLKAVRSIKDKFLDCGYLLIRDTDVEKVFRVDKITKYVRVYKIIGRTFHLCLN